MGKTYRRNQEDSYKSSKNSNEFTSVAYCLDCKMNFDECPDNHLCPYCGSWLMENDLGEIEYGI